MKLKVFRQKTDKKDTYVCYNVPRQKRYEISVIDVGEDMPVVVVDVMAYNYFEMPKEDKVFVKVDAKKYLRICTPFTSLSPKDIENIRKGCPAVLLDSAFGYWVHWLYNDSKKCLTSDKYKQLIYNANSEESLGALNRYLEDYSNKE